MHIVIFSDCYYPVVNGVVISIDTFKNELRKRGHQFRIVTTRCPGNNDNDPSVTRFKPFLPFKPKGGRYPIARPQFVNWQAGRIAHFEPDLIHSQHTVGLYFGFGWEIGVGFLGLKVAQELGIPRVLTYHTLLAEYAHYAPLFPRSVRKILIHKSRLICNQYDYVITPSPSMKRVLREYGVTVPIEAIPTGVNLDDFQSPFSRDELEKKWQIPQDKRILLYVSRVAKEKNVDFLLASLRPLIVKRPDIHLILVGGGPELDKYKALVESWRLSESITFTGMLPKPETNRLYAAAEIFTFPSKTETQGIVIAEAMAAGIPPVAVNIMGPTDVIQDGKNGFLVAEVKEEFSKRVNQLLDNNDLRQRLGQQAKKDAQNYSVEACADKMERLYRKIVHEHHHRS